MKNFIAIISVALLILTILIIWNRNFLMQYYNNYQWIESYNSQNFNEAEEYFSGSLKYAEDEIIYFNQWNNFYKQSQGEKDINKKIELLQKSVEKYSQALEYKKRDFIENNYKIVQQELNKYKQIEEKNKQNQNNSEEQNNSNNNQDNQDFQENNEELAENSQQNSQEESGEQDKQWQSQSDQKSAESDTLTQQQQAELERYLEDLKDIEKNNQRFFNKFQQNHNFFEKFSNDPFLQNDFNRWGEKDW